MVTIYVFRVTGMTSNLTKSQGSFLGKGIVIICGSAHKVYVTSQTLSEAQCPPPPSPMGRCGAGGPQNVLYQGGLYSGPLRGGSHELLSGSRFRIILCNDLM